MEKLKEINFCAFCNSSGYSHASRNYILSLYNSNKYNIKLNIFGGKPSKPAINDIQYELFMKMSRKEHSDDTIGIYHCIPPMQRRMPKFKKNIGFFTFESFSPPEKWINILNKNDAIITPSKFNYRILAHENIKKPIYYIPHCINMKLYHENVKPLYKYNKFTFLFIGTWKIRKGYKNLIESWLTEFNIKDNVQLLIKTDRPKQEEQYINKIKKQLGINKGFAPIILEDKIFDEEQLPKFIKSVNCLIAPTFGEGFCIPGLQCMSLKIPVIITNFSGCKDYANEKTATLLEPEGFILYNNMDGIPQFSNKKWAFLTVKSIRKSMRYVLNNSQKINKKVEYAYSYVRKRFNYNENEIKFANMIRELYA